MIDFCNRALLLIVLALTGAACDQRCNFVSRCEGNEYVTCNNPESIGPTFEAPHITRTRCEGLNPVCLSDGSRLAGCYRSNQPATSCPPERCEGALRVSCDPLKLGDAGVEQRFEYVIDCSRSSDSSGRSQTCNPDPKGSACLDPDR